jgi:6-phosphogluconolactonase
LTMTFPAINRARHVMFLVAGREKAEAVRTVLEGEFRPDDDPAQMVQPETGELDWLLDRAAAALVGPVQP